MTGITSTENWHGTMRGYTRHKKKDGVVTCVECIEAQRIHWRQRRIDHNAHINSLRRLWRQKQFLMHNRASTRSRARKLGSEVGYYTDQEVIDLYGTDCHICGEAIDLSADRRTGFPGWEKSLHIDHVYPLSKGGSDTIDNVKPSHGKCNILKSAKILEENKEEL